MKNIATSTFSVVHSTLDTEFPLHGNSYFFDVHETLIICTINGKIIKRNIRSMNALSSLVVYSTRWERQCTV
jgi:hypothetical protein